MDLVERIAKHRRMAESYRELVSELTAAQLRDKIAQGVVRGGMVAKARSILRAIEGGVRSVHIVDGRTPHSLIAELFTDRGVGTLITA